MEEWKMIKGYEGIYDISSMGRVRSFETGYIYKTFVNQRGYPVITLRKGKERTTKRIHRLVALAFIYNTEGKPQVNHLDGNKLNNNVENLEWCTAQENNQHAVKMGLNKKQKVGANSRKLNKNIAEEIRSKYIAGNCNYTSLAKEYGVHRKTISEIVNNKTYRKGWRFKCSDHGMLFIDFHNYHSGDVIYLDGKPYCKKCTEELLKSSLENKKIQNIMRIK